MLLHPCNLKIVVTNCFNGSVLLSLLSHCLVCCYATQKMLDCKGGGREMENWVMAVEERSQHLNAAWGWGQSLRKAANRKQQATERRHSKRTGAGRVLRSQPQIKTHQGRLKTLQCKVRSDYKAGLARMSVKLSQAGLQSQRRGKHLRYLSGLPQDILPA